jgi:Gpi18-like mannosyltransferase
MTKGLFILLLSALIVRLLLAPYLTYYSDLLIYKAWGINLATYGPLNFYARMWSDYLPGYLYMLMISSWIQQTFSNIGFIIPDEYTYKFFPIIADIISGYFVYKILINYLTPQKSLFGTGIFLFSLSTLALSTFWGQSDGIVTTFLIASLYFLIKQNIPISFALLGLAQITKPIAIISIPIYLVWLLRQKVPFIKILIGGISFLLAIILPFIGFTYANNNVLQTFFLRHFATFDQYQYTSLNAFSYWGGLHGFWVSDQSTFIGMNLRIWGYALYSIPLLITLMVLCFKKTHLDSKILILSQAINYTAMFLFITRMHERHFYFGLSICLIYLIFATPITRIFILLSAIVFILNLFFAYAINAKIPFTLEPIVISLLVFINFATLLMLIKDLIFYKKSA